MTTTARFTEVTNKLNSMFKAANDEGKDKLVSSLKAWLKTGTEKDKKEAIQCFLSDINVY